MAYNGHLSDKEFFELACRWTDSLSTQTAAKWWWAFVEIIVRETYLKGSVRIPGLGTFIATETKETFQKQIDPDTGKEVIYKVPARNIPDFIPSDDFINDVSMAGVTKQYRKRAKKNALTVRDYEREVRAQSLKFDKAVPQSQVDKAKEEFKELLKKKVTKNKAKLERNENEEE